MDKQPTINDVATLACVSKKTVSRVINNSPLLSEGTRARVQAAIAELGFSPNPQARALALGRNFMVVLLHAYPNAQVVLDCQRGILDALHGSDLALAVRPVDRDSSTLLKDMRTFLERQKPLAALILPPISNRDDVAQLCNELGVRCLRISSGSHDNSDGFVLSNDRDIVAEVCQMLVDLGHTRIGFVRGPAGFRSTDEREKGYLTAMDRAGIAVLKEYIFPGNYRFESGIDAGQKLLSLANPPTAILASNDYMAAGVMRAASNMGFNVPDDLSVVGFGASPTSLHISPQLTTVYWPIKEMSEIAVRKMVAEFLPGDAFDEASFCGIVKASLIERESVAPPRKR